MCDRAASSMGGRAASSKFISIASSHYVERARWALDFAGVQYIEEKYPPLVHWWGVKSAGFATHSVPALITPSGERIGDSTDILKYVAATFPAAGGLYPEEPQQLSQVQELETLFGKRLGPLTRVICYQALFHGPSRDVLRAICDVPGTPVGRRLLFRANYYLIKFMMMKGMRINQQSAEACLVKVKTIFEQVNALLADGRPFLVKGTTAPTAADITFAALAALVVLPSNYGGASGAWLPQPGQWEGYPDAELRGTPAGQHVIKMYELYRKPGGSSITTASTEVAPAADPQLAGCTALQ